MKWLSFLVMIAILSISLSSCYTAQYGNPSITLFYNAGINGFSGNSANLKDRQGEACAISVLALLAIGDASIQKAAGKAGITKISNVTHQTKMNLFVVQEVCTIVRGQ